MEVQVRQILERPFPDDALKQRLGPNGMRLTYAEVQHYIDRLNEAFAGSWSWELIARQVVEGQIIVEGRLSAAGITKTGLGGTTITRRRDDNQMVGLADDIKTAEADAIKRSCRLFGIGRELYVSDEDVPGPTPQARTPQVSPRRPAAVMSATAPKRLAAPAIKVATGTTMPQATVSHPVRNRLTSKQFAALRSLSRSVGYDERTFKEDVRQRFGAEVAYLSSSQASELIGELLASTNGLADREAG